MQIIKDNEHSVLLKHFNIQSEHFLAITTMLYFDLLENRLYNEQKMWEEVMPYLRYDQPLDEALPKNRAEFLAYGHCFSQNPTKAKQVKIKVGDIEKTLDVIGDRYYYKDILGNIKISEPKDFTKIKIGFENAYGGGSNYYNPIGKGFLDDENIEDYKTALHNIDEFTHQSASSLKEKNAIPQSFEPLSVGWKTRMDMAGTYDDNWYKTRWPYFADDLDKNYFNTALNDQQQDEYFIGNEEILIQNMNKNYTIIHSYLPKEKIKTFLTRTTKKDIYSDEVLREEFFEVENKIDTIVIFTDIAKAVIVYRAVTKCIDDEYSDITQGFFLTENDNDSSKELEFYKELKDRKINRSFDIQSHNKEMEKLAKEVSDIPRRFDFEINKLKGESPSISPSPKIALDNSIFEFKKMEKEFEYIAQNGVMDILLKESPENKDLFLKNDFVKEINNDFKIAFKNAINSITKMNPIEKLSSLYNLPQDILNQFKKSEEEMLSHYYKGTKEILVEEKNCNLKSKSISKSLKFADSLVDKNKQSKKLELMLKNKENEFDALLIHTWEDAGNFFVGNCKFLLKENINAKEKLENCGFRDTTLDISHISYNRVLKNISSKQWAIEKSFEIPKGFVLPIFEKDNLKKIIIRPNIIYKNNENENILIDDKNDIEIVGSSKCEVVIYGSYKKILVITDDIIKAWLLNQDIYDLANIIVIKNENELYLSDFYNKNKHLIKYIFSTTIKLNTNPDINIKEYFLDNFLSSYNSKKFRETLLDYVDKDEYILNLQNEEKKKKNMKHFYIPKLEIKKIHNDMKTAINKKVENGMSSVIEKIKLELKKINYEISENSKEIKESKFVNEEIMNKSSNIKSDIYNETIHEFEELINAGIENFKPKLNNNFSIKDILLKQKEELKDIKKQLHQVDEANFNKTKEFTMNEISQLEKKFETEEFKKLEALEDEIEKELQEVRKIQKEGSIPSWAKKEFKNLFDIDINCKIKEFENIDEIIDHYDQKGSFKGVNFEGFDLSGINLSNRNFQGANFSYTILNNTNLSNSNLKMCNFSGVASENTDFSNSDFSSSRLIDLNIKNCNFYKSNLLSTILQGNIIENSNFESTNFKNSMFLNIDVKNSLFTSSNFEDILIENSVFKDSKFNFLNLEKYLINQSEFTNSSFFKSKFIRGTIVGTIFSNIIFDESIFEVFSLHNDSELETISAINCLLEKVSFVKSKILNSNFSNSKLRNLNIDKSKIKSSLFINCEAQGSCITRTLFEDSNLSRSDFMQTSFRKTFFKNIDLSKTNLYRADFFDIKVNKLNLKDSNIKGTLLFQNENYKLFQEIEY